jgi:Putative sensor
MNGTITMNTSTSTQPHTGNWATRGAVATGRGLALAGLTLAAYGLWVVLLIALALAPLYVGLPLVHGTLRAVRRLETTVRQRCADWCGVAIPVAYVPESADGRRSFWASFGTLITDPGTWRDLRWTAVDMLVGWLLTLAPAGLIAWGLFGVVMPAVWHPIVTAHGNNWYAFIHVATASTAWLSAALGIAFIALGLLTAPWFLRRYAALARSLYKPA